jgi:hypothetical protein
VYSFFSSIFWRGSFYPTDINIREYRKGNQKWTMQKNLLQFCSVGFINNCFHDIAHGESYFGSVLIMLIPFIYIFREKSNLNDEHDFMVFHKYSDECTFGLIGAVCDVSGECPIFFHCSIHVDVKFGITSFILNIISFKSVI